MADTIPIVQMGQNPTPSLPNQVVINAPKVQPGNSVQAAPVIPASMPPNVDGGPASFSALTRSLQDMVTAKTTQLDASAKAMEANRAVDSSAAALVNAAQADTIKSYMNIQKAASLPGGAQGGLSKIIGLFDSDFNFEKQSVQVELSTAKARQAAATADALKTQNNLLPDLLGKVSDATKVVFDAQKDANDLFIKQGTLADQQMKTKLEAARLRLSMSAEHRAATEFAIRGMSTDQITAQLALADQGKGKFANLGGLLQERLVQEKSAEVGLATAQNALAKGNRTEYEEGLSNMVSHLPVDYATAEYEKAKKAGSPVVSLPGGAIDPKTKKQATIDIPFNVFEQGLIRANETHDTVQKSLAADLNTRMNIGPKITNMFNTYNAFAGVDQRATQGASRLGAIVKSMDMKDPDSVYRGGILLDALQKDQQTIVKEQAEKFHDPEAKAGVMGFGTTGKFDAQGGIAVTAESAGVPALNRNSKFPAYWQSLNSQIATVIQAEHLTNNTGTSAGKDGSINTADALSLIASLQSKGPQGREKINTIAQNILADPIKSKELGRIMQGTMRVDAINQTLNGLVHQKDADPIWGYMDTHSGEFMTSGQIDPNKILGRLEAATVKSGGKLNYSQQFLAAIGNYAVNANNSPAGDVSYTMQDHAAVAAHFGGNPESDVAGHLHWELRQLAERHAEEMRQRVNADVSGKTQHDAAKAMMFGPELDALMGPAGIMTDFVAQKIFKKTGKSPNDVPSATGTGMTAAEVKAKFPGGY